MSSDTFHMTVENYLLAAMPRELYDKLAPNMKRVSLQQGQMLHYPGETIEHLYFPYRLRPLDHYDDERRQNR
jgi:hypothetical protein